MLPNDFDPSCHPSTFYTRAPTSDALGILGIIVTSGCTRLVVTYSGVNLAPAVTAATALRLAPPSTEERGPI
jgi:hypothetical protein